MTKVEEGRSVGRKEDCRQGRSIWEGKAWVVGRQDGRSVGKEDVRKTGVEKKGN